MYPASEDLEHGDVVMLDSAEPLHVRKADNSNTMIGIVSTAPALVMRDSAIELGSQSTSSEVFIAGTEAPIALVGRVPIKVNLEGGAISIGDPLTVSSEPGVAKKATGAGRIIGFALHNFEGPNEQNNGKIMVFLNPGWFGNDLAVQENVSGQIVNLDPEQLRAGLAVLGLVVSEDGVLEVGTLKAKKIVAEEFEMRDKATGEIYCTWIENGEWRKVLGECASAASNSEIIETPTTAGEPSAEAAATDEVATTTEEIATTTEESATTAEPVNIDEPASTTTEETIINTEPVTATEEVLEPEVTNTEEIPTITEPLVVTTEPEITIESSTTDSEPAATPPEEVSQ